MLDLYHATRKELIALLLAERDAKDDLTRQLARVHTTLATQQTVISQLTEQVGQLQATVAALTGAATPPPETSERPKGMPGLKPTEAPERPVQPRKRRNRGYGRHRMAVTERQVHVLDQCPACGTRLTGGSVKRTREVLEVPVAPVTVIEHVYLERRCPGCGRRCVPPPELDGVVVGQSRLGVGLVSLIATLREEARLPFAVIQTLLQTVYGLTLSVGGLVGAVQTVATQAAAVVEQIQTAIRASPVVHADETGLRENGQNGYVWTLSTPDHRYFVRGSRAKSMLIEGLGETFGGVLVSDFYAAYTSYDGLHQYCWAHLLRDIHDLTVAHPDEAGVQGWATAVHDVFTRAQAVAMPDPRSRRQAQHTAERELLALCRPYLDGTHPQTTLCQRIEKYLTELFVFVADPAVPATNNTAERSLRHLVTARKISGGTRSDTGSTTKTRLASLFGTWRAQGRNPFDECRQLLASPQG